MVKILIFNEVLKDLSSLLLECNATISFQFIPSANDPANLLSYTLSDKDCMLSESAWVKVGHRLGLHMLDLMSLDCNVKKDAARILPRHFTTHPTLFCAGINVFAQAVSSEDIYVFASFVLVGPLLRFLEAANISSIIKVPQLYPLPFWWLILAPMLLHVYSWGIRGDLNMLLLLSSKNFFIPRPLQWDLFAFTVNIC